MVSPSFDSRVLAEPVPIAGTPLHGVEPLPSGELIDRLHMPRSSTASSNSVAVREAGDQDRARWKRIPIPRHGGTTVYLRVDSIDWIEGASQYARLHHDGQSSLVRMPLKQLQATLDPRQFLRVHRSTILNLRRVRELRVDAPHRRWAILDDDQKVAVSPAHWDALQEALLLSF